MKRAFQLGFAILASSSFIMSSASAQSRLLGFAGAGLGYSSQSDVQSKDYQQVSAAYEFVRNGQTDKALALLLPLQADSFAPAMTLLGSMYAVGRGVARDDSRAAALYATAAGAGDPAAMYLYGYALDNGIGVEQDRSEAQQWMQRASDSGIIELQQAVRRYRAQMFG